jgi:hypothetical protein
MGGPGAKPFRCRQALDSLVRDHDIYEGVRRSSYDLHAA